VQDTVYAARAVRRSLGYALFTAGVIGLGVGAATAVFSVLEPFVFAPLPFDEPERLVWIQNDPAPGDLSLSAVTVRSANLHDFRKRSRSFTGLTGYNAFFDHAAYTLTGAGEPTRLVGADVAHDFLDVLGVKPLHGRSFQPEEGVRGGPGAIILSHGFWVRRFAADPGVVGTTLTLDDHPRTVVGVLPAAFDFSSIFSPGVPVDVLLPFPVIADGDPGYQGNTLYLIGRLRDGAGIEAAAAEIDAVMAGLAEERPDRWGLGAELSPLHEHIAGPFRPALFTLAAAAATLLLIVCINVSNLFLARAPGRAREVAVRKALGASRRRMVRQLVMESTGIALLGAAVGGALASVLTAWATRAAALRVPLLDAVTVDGSALLFAVGIAILTGLVVGLVPALRVSEGQEATVLRDGSRGQSQTRSARHLRETLVVAEVTLACVLLVTCGLLVRSFRAVLAVDLGFDAHGVTAWQLAPSDPPRGARAAGDFFGPLVDRVAAVPGVEGVGLIDGLPLGRNRAWAYRVIGEAEPEEGENQVFPHIIDPAYLSTMRIPLVDGRGFDRQDTEGTGPVILLNESGARLIFGTESALGRRMRFWGPWEWEVVGVVADVRHVSPEVGPGIQVYFPVAQMPDFHTLDMVVRSELPPAEVTSRVAEALREIDPAMPVGETWTVDSTVDRALSARRFMLGVLGAFGIAALLLAVLGVYGVLSHSVAERETEMGIRMALGASGPTVVRSVLGRTVALAGLGVVAGAVLSLIATRLLASLLYGVSPTDPITFVGMALVLLAAAALAGAVPAVRAARQGAGVLRGG
jgi:predicted permease